MFHVQPYHIAPLIYFGLWTRQDKKIKNKLGARTLGARSRGSKNVTYIQQTTDKKVNTEEKSQKYGVIL